MGQSYQGGVRGTVEDALGAAIPKAKITLTNDGTAEAKTALTNNDGGFEFTQLIPATYTLIAESPSFKKFERKNITVGTQEFVIVDIKLEVGAVTESVLVTTEVPLVETANASQGQVLDNQKLVDLPNLGRNPYYDVEVVAEYRAGRSSGLQSHGGSERLFHDLHCRRPGARQ
jgi:hypothetical protein